jgi:hypothetical protein
MAKLSDMDREIIRRAPVGSAPRLAALFGVSLSYVEKVRSGTRGFPGPCGLGMRPWVLRSAALLQQWRTQQLERIEKAYQRAVEALDRDEALTLAPGEPGTLMLFRGALALKPRVPPPVVLTSGRPAAAQPGLLYDRRGPR